MTLTFISNYINHHQIPFCDACYAALGEDFRFVQTMPMEEERRRMGWDEKDIPPYVVAAYEDKERADALVLDADIALVGWAGRDDLVDARMKAGKPTVRVTERLYRDGQWKAISPRGLLHKYREHIRYRSAPLYLLAAGGYVASDMRVIHAYPGKCYRWGYFPPTFQTDEETLFRGKAAHTRPELLWAGRFLDWKHPDDALRAAARLKEAGVDFHLTMIGDGEMHDTVYRMAAELNGTPGSSGTGNVGTDAAGQTSGVGACAESGPFVTLTGFLPPTEIRHRMEQADIFLFTSDRQEGWGAVLNEAMNAGLAVLAGNEAGSSVNLIRQGENGILYRSGDSEMLGERLLRLVQTPDAAQQLGRAAFRTITGLWNAEHAAAEFLRFCEAILAGRTYDAPAEGPMSLDPAQKPFVPTAYPKVLPAPSVAVSETLRTAERGTGAAVRSEACSARERSSVSKEEV